VTAAPAACTGRLAVVTGGSRGIGRAVVERLAGDGDRVVAVGRDAGALRDVVGCGAGRVSAEVCDVTDEAAVDALFARLGPVDVLVPNAGASAAAPLDRTTVADWERQIAVNATGVFLCVRAALAGMRARDSGRIVVVASTAALAGQPYTAAYTASKHAAVGLVRAVASEVAGTGVTANAVCPAFVESEMTDRSVARIVSATGRTDEQARQALERSSPLGRLLAPSEVAHAVAFLADRRSGAVNGQTLVLDGGGLQR
jgi:NAD(P)-dependent dehydrogenase (short-subunit alcohol dehydrogenase family)